MDGIKFARPSTLNYYEFNDIVDFFANKYNISIGELNDYFSNICEISFEEVWHLFVDPGRFIILKGFIMHHLSPDLFECFMIKMNKIKPNDKKAFDEIIDFFTTLFMFWPRKVFINYGERYTL